MCVWCVCVLLGWGFLFVLVLGFTVFPSPVTLVDYLSYESILPFSFIVVFFFKQNQKLSGDMPLNKHPKETTAIFQSFNYNKCGLVNLPFFYCYF